MLQCEDVHTYYGRSYVLQGLSLYVKRGELVAILGRNGVGKTTTLKTILGLVPPTAGRICFKEREISGLPAYEIPRLGVGYVPQRDIVFPQLTVMENLRIGAVKSLGSPVNYDRVFDLFPRLKERLGQVAAFLSGGERQMVAIARALIGNPTLILFDEPTAGLMPTLAQKVGEIIKTIALEGVAVLLVEQNIKVVIDICQRLYIMERGRMKYNGPMDGIDELTLFNYLV